MMEPPAGRGGPQRIPRPADARPGSPPPWNHLAADERHVELGTLLGRLRSYVPQFAEWGMQQRGRTSAVLIALWEQSGEAWVLLTRRSASLRSHTHEVAFPGGRHDEVDGDHITTALRETQEEVALVLDRDTIVGGLDRFVTGGSGSLVHPYVAVLEAAPTGLVANPTEVEAILPVRLNELLLDEVWREERWSIDGGPSWPVTFFELHGDTVWGATANMLRQLLTMATDPA